MLCVSSGGKMNKKGFHTNSAVVKYAIRSITVSLKNLFVMHGFASVFSIMLIGFVGLDTFPITNIFFYQKWLRGKVA